MLQLTRPLVVLDLETTGIIPEEDRIVEIGIIKVQVDGSEKEWETLVNPCMPIPPEATEVHGITDEMVKDAPKFTQLGEIIARGLKGCDVCGYNVRDSDLKVFDFEFQRMGYPFDSTHFKVVDGFKLWTKLRPRNLTAFFEEMTGEKFEEAHRALPDTRATWRAIKAMFERYPDIPREVDKLHDMAFGDNGDMLAGGKFYFRHNEATFAFGKYKGKTLKAVLSDTRGREYVQWICREMSFSPEIRRVCQNAVMGVFPERKKKES